MWMECVAEIPQVQLEGNGHCSSHPGGMQAEGSQATEESYSFSRELISFSLYGKIPPKCKRPWNESLSARIAEVQESYRNIPAMLYFAPSSVSFDGIGVYTVEPLPKATVLGPYFGKAVHKDRLEGHSHYEWLWEVYQDSSLSYFIDASDPKYGNWMNFIQCARSKAEQNLKALQYNGYLYFEATRDIAVGEELLVWYDETQYDTYMGIPTGYRGKMTDDIQATGMDQFAAQPSSSGRNEQDSFTAAPYASTPNITGASHLSDTSTSSAEDSGISMSLEHSGRPLPVSTGSLEQSMPEYSNPPPPQIEGYEQGMSSGPVANNDQLPPYSESFQHRYSDSRSPSASYLEPSQASFQEASQWLPANGHPQNSIMKHTHQLGESWPLKSINKARSSTMLYGMFTRSEDGTHWQCEECKRLFSSQGSLRAHARIHTGERPYQCQYCFRTFCQASTLRSHERLHTGEKPYKCEHCGRAFTQSAGLRSHLKTHRYDS